MLDSFYQNLGPSSAAVIIISIALMLFLGFAMTRLTKRLKLPSVTAYIITGILIGPYCMNLIPQSVIAGTDFLADIALAFLAFSVGEFFKVSRLKKNGPKATIIMLFEAGLSSIAIFVLTYFILRLPIAYSIILAALASATAPASMVMIIRQTHAKGNFVDTLLQVVALDNVISLVAYSVAISIALSSLSNAAVSFSFRVIAMPVVINVGVLILGGLFGVLLKLLMPGKRTTDNRLIIAVGVLFAFCGVCAILDVSPLLGCMSMGTVYINITEDDKLFKQLNYFSPPILLLFFVRSGLNFNLTALVSTSNTVGNLSLLAIGILYCVIRVFGKYVGAYLGCLCVKDPKETRNYLGLALIPQAGVAIGLATLCARTLGGKIGSDLQTIILAASILYEIIGPACTKLALYLSKSYTTKLEELTSVAAQTDTGQPKNSAEILIARIQQIQAELPCASHSLLSEEEDAFLEAEEEQYQVTNQLWRRRFWNRK